MGRPPGMGREGDGGGQAMPDGLDAATLLEDDDATRLTDGRAGTMDLFDGIAAEQTAPRRAEGGAEPLRPSRKTPDGATTNPPEAGGDAGMVPADHARDATRVVPTGSAEGATDAAQGDAPRMPRGNLSPMGVRIWEAYLRARLDHDEAIQDAADCSGRDDVIPMMRALTCATDASKRMMAQIMALQAAEISHRPPTPKVPRKARA